MWQITTIILSIGGNDLIEKKPINHNSNLTIDKIETKPIDNHVLRTSRNNDFIVEPKYKLIIEDDDEKIDENCELIK